MKRREVAWQHGRDPMTLRTMSQFKLLELNERGTFVSEEALSLGQSARDSAGHDGT
jgi:hypothetical protein